jgi:hypothetical protein
MRFTLILNLLLLGAIGNLHAQNCLEVETILVNACDDALGSPEGLNEMFRFRIGPNPISISDIQIVNGWPSQGVNTLPFNGFVQNSFTESKTIELNATITESCGYLIEPPAGIIPAGKSVLAITSYEVSVGLNSFANLTDTLFVIYHQHTGEVGGHFLNYNITNPQEQTLRIQVNGAFPCYEEVTYIRGNLVDANGYNADQNGAFVDFTSDGVPTYGNINCQAPFEPFSADWTNPGLFCENVGAIDLSTYITGTLGGTFSGQGVTGTFFNPYGLQGPIDITYTVNPPNDCNTIPASITHIVHISPLPEIPSDIITLVQFCANQVNQLSVEAHSEAFNYFWELPNGWYGDSIGSSIIVQTGDFGGAITVYSQNECGNSPIQTLQAELNLVNNNVVVNGSSLSAVALNAEYQWLNCIDSSAINGETFSDFFPPVQGYYAVEVTQNGCIDTSSCIQILITTAKEIKSDFKWNVYPNPIQDYIHINSLIKISEKVDLSIHAIDGREILIRELNFSDNSLDVKLDCSSISSGVYLLKLHANDKVFKKIVAKL